MSTYAADFPKRFFDFLLKKTGLKKENFTSIEKLRNVVEKFESLDLCLEVKTIILDVVKAIVGLTNTAKDNVVFLADKFLDVLFHVLDILREYAVVRLFLSVFQIFGPSVSILVCFLINIIYYLSEFLTCDMLKNLKKYMKEKFRSYWNSHQSIEY